MLLRTGIPTGCAASDTRPVTRCAPATRAAWLDLLDAEHANQRAALERLIAGGRLGEAARLLADTWLALGAARVRRRGTRLDRARPRPGSRVRGSTNRGCAFLELVTRGLPVCDG